MSKPIPTVLLFLGALLFYFVAPPSSGASDRNQVVGIVEKMKIQFQDLRDYSCKVEQIYFRDGQEDQHIFFAFYFKKENWIRIDFSYPQSGVTILYRKGEETATVLPIRSLPVLKFRISIDHPFLRTFTGQQVNQTDIGYFIDFLDRSVAESNQPNFDFEEEKDEITFWMIARDYLQGKNLEKYRITLSKSIWLPLRIERFSLDNIPIERSLLGHYQLNSQLPESFFLP